MKKLVELRRYEKDGDFFDERGEGGPLAPKSKY